MRPARRLATTLILGCCLGAPAAVAATGDAGAGAAAVEGPAGDEEVVFPTDPRMIEAAALLSDREQYDRAIGLYRSVLQEYPAEREARQWLARILSWKGEHDEALAQYALLLDTPEPAYVLRVEQAQVLSWAGRYDEAEAAFRALLDEAPEDPRVVRGLGHVYQWSGQREQAIEWLERSQTLEPDPEVATTLDTLKRRWTGSGDNRTTSFADNNGVRITRSRVASRLEWDHRTSLEIAGTWTRASDDSGERDGLSGTLGLRRQLPRGFEAGAELGYSGWQQAPGHLLAAAQLGWTRGESTALTTRYEHGSFLVRSDSFATIDEGLDYHGLRLQAWQQLAPGWSGFAFVDELVVGDGNLRSAVGGSVEYSPFEAWELAVGASLSWTGFRDSAEAYYSPHTDLGSELSLRGRYPILPWLALDASAGVGLGLSEEGELTGFGLGYSVGGGLRMQLSRVALGLTASRFQTQRGATYSAHSFGLDLSVGF